MTIDVAPKGAFCAPLGDVVHGDRHAVHAGRRLERKVIQAQRREDPPPLLADLDCAVSGSDPFLRVCLGSSVISESTPSPEHAPRTKVPTDRTFGPAAQQDSGTRPPFAARSVLGGTRHLPLWTNMPDTCPYRYPAWSFRRSLPSGRRCVRPSASRRWHSEGPDPARTDPPTNPAVYEIKSGDAPRGRARQGADFTTDQLAMRHAYPAARPVFPCTDCPVRGTA